MKTSAKIIIGACVCVAVFACGAGWHFSNLIIRFPVHSLEQDRYNLKISNPQQFDLPGPEQATILHDDIRLGAWFFEHPKAQECGVVLLHGYSGTRYGTLKYTPLFWERGCHLLLLDLRRHGASTGEYSTWGQLEKYDVATAVEWLSEKTGLPHSQIGVMGESMGGAIALQTGAIMSDLAFVAADSSFKSLEAILSYQGELQYGHIISVLLPLTRLIVLLRTDFDISTISIEQAAASLQMPVFLLHSAQDDYTPMEHSKAIYDWIPHPDKRLYVTNWGAGHGQSIDVNLPEYQHYMSEFLNTYVIGFGRDATDEEPE